MLTVIIFGYDVSGNRYYDELKHWKYYVSKGECVGEGRGGAPEPNRGCQRIRPFLVWLREHFDGGNIWNK
jgi:hypothetical protein